jgi:hypothetical protein
MTVAGPGRSAAVSAGTRPMFGLVIALQLALASAAFLFLRFTGASGFGA